MNDKENASTDDLIEALYKQERHPDLSLIQTLLERGTEIVPALIDIVETELGWPQTHAILLLCELRAETALPALQEVLSGPEGEVQADWLLDDAMINFGPAALDTLEAVAAERAAHLQIQLRRQGWQLGTVDALIAAVALRYDLTLLTADNDFAAIPALKQENWLVNNQFDAIKN